MPVFLKELSVVRWYPLFNYAPRTGASTLKGWFAEKKPRPIRYRASRPLSPPSLIKGYEILESTCRIIL